MQKYSSFLPQQASQYVFLLCRFIEHIGQVLLQFSLSSISPAIRVRSTKQHKVQIEYEK